MGLAPDGVVRSFYEGYLAYVANGVGAKCNPLVDRLYRDCPVLSERFVAEVDEAIGSFDKGGFDPILMAQDVPSGSPSARRRFWTMEPR